MEYFVIITLLLYGIVNFDFKSNNDRNDSFFKFIFILMTLMSGLAFRMGSDSFGYEIDFYTEYTGSIKSIFQSSSSFLSYRQIGWELLSAIVYKVFHSFVVFKLIQACFLHYALFKLIKEHTKYRYIALLLYFLLLFPHINFNVLRESFAIAFFFLSIPFLEKAKWVKYYALIFCAVMFHTGALMLLFVPLASLINLSSTKKVIIASILLFAFVIIVAPNDFVRRLEGLLMLAENEHIEDQLNFYVERSEAQGITNIGKTLLFYVINILPLLYLSSKNDTSNKALLGVAFLFVILNLFRAFIPIMYRFCDYFQSVWFICVAFFIVDCVKSKFWKQKTVMACLLILLYVYPVRSYFSINERYGAPSIVQYYPYYSVIHKGYSQERERLFSR